MTTREFLTPIGGRIGRTTTAAALGLAATIGIVATTGLAAAHSGGGYGGGGMMGGGYGGGGMMGGGYGGTAMGGGLFGFGGFLWPLLLVGGLLLLGYWFVEGRGEGGSRALDRDPALETLRERYARGELSDEEYVERKRRLEG
ncbi:MAG: SHOCT domain-containing protein [Halanaeroarchaeum sp.]